MLAPLHPEGWIGVKLDTIIKLEESNAAKLDKLAESLAEQFNIVNNKIDAQAKALSQLSSDLVTDVKAINNKLDEIVGDLEPGPPVKFIVTTVMV